MRRLLLNTAISMLLAACGTTPEMQTPSASKGPAPSATPSVATPGPSTQGVTTTVVAADPLKDPQSILSKRTVYFDYDSDAIKPDFVPIIEAHAKYLRDHRAAKMLIQGDADERGSREYNIGLGQRRADTLKTRLVLLGATEAQIESVSLGEEKPVCAEHAEGCWWKNRRDDMLYAGRGEF